MILFAVAALLAGVLVNDPAGVAVGNVSGFGAPCVADLNGDGIDDLIIDRHKSAAWDVYAGQPDGTFSRMADAPAKRSDVHGCVVADFNGDSLPDVVAIKGACQGTCMKTDDLWLSDRPGVWSPKSWMLGPKSYDRNRAAVAVDLNGDGWPELVTVASGSPTGSAHRIYWNQAGVGFDRQQIAKASGDSTCVQTVDLDGDGTLDVLVCAASGLAVSYGPSYAGLVDLGVGVVESVRPGPDGGWLVVRRDRLDFTDATLTSVGSWPLVYGRDAAMVDFAGDGAAEVVVVQSVAGRAPSDPAAHFVLERTEGGWVRVDIPQPARGAGAHVVAVGRRALITNGGRSGVTGLWDRKGPRQMIELAA